MQHKRQICRCIIVFYPKKIKLQPVPPSMPLEALLIPVNLTDSDSNGIDGGTGCNVCFQLLICSISWFRYRFHHSGTDDDRPKFKNC